MCYCVCTVHTQNTISVCLDINVVFNGISLSIIYTQFCQVLSSIRCFLLEILIVNIKFIPSAFCTYNKWFSHFKSNSHTQIYTFRRYNYTLFPFHRQNISISKWTFSIMVFLFVYSTNNYYTNLMKFIKSGTHFFPSEQYSLFWDCYNHSIFFPAKMKQYQ